jgi:hypothetical protein
VQVPAPSQVSAWHGLPSLVHVTPLPAFTIVQLVPLQVELTWQSVGVHVNPVPTQVPPLHASLDVQRSPSSQVVPSITLDHAVVDVAGVHT